MLENIREKLKISKLTPCIDSNNKLLGSNIWAQVTTLFPLPSD